MVVGIVLALWKVGCLRQYEYSSFSWSPQRRPVGRSLPNHEKVQLLSEAEWEEGEMNDEELMGGRRGNREQEHDPEGSRSASGEVEFQSRRSQSGSVSGRGFTAYQ